MKTVRAWVPNGWWILTTVRWRGLRMLSDPGHPAALLAELGRALAAEQRYHALRHDGAAARARDGLSTADVSRRIFKEFYAGGWPPGES